MAALLPLYSRSRKAQGRPANNTEAVLWIQKTLRYQEKSTDSPVWPVGKVRHGKNDSTLSAKVRGNQDLKGEHSLFPRVREEGKLYYQP